MGPRPYVDGSRGLRGFRSLVSRSRGTEPSVVVGIGSSGWGTASVQSIRIRPSAVLNRSATSVTDLLLPEGRRRSDRVRRADLTWRFCARIEERSPSASRVLQFERGRDPKAGRAANGPADCPYPRLASMTAKPTKTPDAAAVHTCARCWTARNPGGPASCCFTLALMADRRRATNVEAIMSARRVISSVNQHVENARGDARGPPELARDLQHIGGLPNISPIDLDRIHSERSSRISTRSALIAEATQMSRYLRDTIVRCVEALAKHKEAAVILAMGIAVTLVLRYGLGLG